MEHLTEEQKAAYAELIVGGKTEYADENIAMHINQCDECAAECVELSFIVDEINASKQHKSRRIIAMVASIAAALLIPFTVWLGVLSFSNDEPEIELLASYTESAQNEKLVAQFSGNFRGNEASINTPSIVEVKLGEEAVMSWSSAKSLIIDVLDNQNEEIISETINGNHFIFKPESKGLYYWKLYNNDFDLLFCGKIIVK